MTTQDKQKKRDEKAQKLRDFLTERLGADILNSPEIKQLISEFVGDYRDDPGAIAPATPGETQNGTGLIELIGLAGDAPTNLGDVNFAPGISNYDDSVTRERILAAADLYYAMQHEILGLFRVVLKLKDLFNNGAIQISTGEGAFGLYRFDKQQILRYRHRERLQAYNRLFGYGSTSPIKSTRPNVEFDVLFTNFVHQVVAYYQSKRLAEVIQAASTTARMGSFTSVRRGGLDLRNNIKSASYGNIAVMRIEVMQLLDEAFRIISAPDILKVFGAENGWDVVEEVSRGYFNQRNLNVSQRSRLGLAGREIIGAIADSWVTSDNRTGFEVGLQDIEISVDEWYTSAQALGLLTTRQPRVIHGKTLPTRRKPRLP